VAIVGRITTSFFFTEELLKNALSAILFNLW
jgi:hypothetical protein